MRTFSPVLQVAALLRGFRCPWYVAGGWAIDLFLGHVTREHEDIDIAILRDDQEELQTHLPGWAFEKAVDGRWTAWTAGERLDPPIHEINATRKAGSPKTVEFLLNESSDGVWRFRRNPAIKRPLDQIGIRTASGVPCLAPEIVLLYKAKAPVAKDADDFDVALPSMEPEARNWLRDALEVCHPGHRWLSSLG